MRYQSVSSILGVTKCEPLVSIPSTAMSPAILIEWMGTATELLASLTAGTEAQPAQISQSLVQ
jgi:hypothetical protein